MGDVFFPTVIIVSWTKPLLPPGALALPGVCFCVADLMLSLSPVCTDEVTCISGTGQLLQGWWLSTPSLRASLSVLGSRNPTEHVVVKQQCAGNRGQSRGLGACAPSAVALGSVSCWQGLLLTTLGRPWGGGCYLPSFLTLTMLSSALVHSLSTAASWQMWLCHMPWAAGSWMDTPATRHLHRWRGWSLVGLWSGALRRDLGEAFTNSCYPTETPAWGISKTPSLSKAEASPSRFPKAIQDAGAFPNPSKGWAEGHWWPEHAPWVQWPAGVFKGGSSHMQWGEEPGLFLA